MSNCGTDLVCGTGGWTGPKPGDPDNNSILTATPAFGGIDVQWTLPTTNAHAVAHVHIYRGTSNNFIHASRLVSVSGNFHHDKITGSTPIRYFYWIEVVSINGTVGKPIGPASATARPLIADLIEQLTGKIDAGVLAQSLKTEIARIQGLEDGITKQEKFTKNEVAALGSVIHAIQATLDDTAAVVLQETHVRATENEAMAKQTTTAQAALGKDIASVSTDLTTEIEKVGDVVTKIGAQWTAKVDVNGLVGGFGIYNDGQTVEAGFDVDRFWVGKTANKRKPFIIENNEVFINEAVINKLTFSKLKDERGNFIVENGKMKADYVQSKVITADWIDSKNLTIKDAQGKVIFSATQKLGGAHIAKGSIGEVHIMEASINTAHIKNLSVDTIKITNHSITRHVSYSGIDKEASLVIDLPAAGNITIIASRLGSIHGYITLSNPGFQRESTRNISLYIDGSLKKTHTFHDVVFSRPVHSMGFDQTSYTHTIPMRMLHETHYMSAGKHTIKVVAPPSPTYDGRTSNQIQDTLAVTVWCAVK